MGVILSVAHRGRAVKATPIRRCTTGEVATDWPSFDDRRARRRARAALRVDRSLAGRSRALTSRVGSERDLSPARRINASTISPESLRLPRCLHSSQGQLEARLPARPPACRRRHPPLPTLLEPGRRAHRRRPRPRARVMERGNRSDCGVPRSSTIRRRPGRDVGSSFGVKRESWRCGRRGRIRRRRSRRPRRGRRRGSSMATARSRTACLPPAGQRPAGQREPFQDHQRPLNAPQRELSQPQSVDQVAQVPNRPRRDDNPLHTQLGEL